MRNNGLVTKYFRAEARLWVPDSALPFKYLRDEQRRFIKKVEKLRHQHEIAGGYEVKYTEYTKPVTSPRREAHLDDPRSDGQGRNYDEHMRLDTLYPAVWVEDHLYDTIWFILEIRKEVI